MKKLNISKKIKIETISNEDYKGGAYFNIGFGFCNTAELFCFGVDLGFIHVDIVYYK